MKKTLVLLLAPVVLAGCSSVSNLTPSQMPHNDSGTYTVEAKWHSNRRAVLEDTIKPVVQVNGQEIPMTPVPVVKDRWEAAIPVAPGQSTVQYRFKFDYKVNKLIKQKPDSVISPEYQLTIK